MQPFKHTCEHNHCLLDLKCFFIQPYICIHEHTHCWMHSPTCIPTPVEKHVANDCWLLVYLEWMSTDDYPLAYDPAGVDTIQSTSSQQLMGVCMGHGNRVSSYTCDCMHYGTCIHYSSNDSFASNAGIWPTNKYTCNLRWRNSTANICINTIQNCSHELSPQNKKINFNHFWSILHPWAHVLQA